MGYVPICPPRTSRPPETRMSYREMFVKGHMGVDEIRGYERQCKERHEAPFWNATTISGAIITLCLFSWMAGVIVGYCEGVKERAAVNAEANQ